MLPRKDMADEWAGVFCDVGTVLYQLGTHRRGARTLEQSVVAFRNALSERTSDKNAYTCAITQNNLAAALQMFGEREEDIASLESSIPLYDAALKVLSNDAVPLIWAMVSANKASAMYSLAVESDYLDMAEATIVEFDKICKLFEGTEYKNYHAKALERSQQARELVASLQV